MSYSAKSDPGSGEHIRLYPGSKQPDNQHSEEGNGYGEGVVRPVPFSQVGSGRCQRTHQPLRSEVVPCRFYSPLTVP